MPRALPQLAFSYPRRGLEGRFNTIRLGVGAVEDCRPGKVVELVDARTKKVLGRATVERLHIGHLFEMAHEHIAWAHNFKDVVPRPAPADLIASMKKRYPPGRVNEDSVVTVIYLLEKTDEALQNP